MIRHLPYTGGAEHYKQVIFKLHDEIDDLADDLTDAMNAEFPKGTDIYFKYGRGASFGTVHKCSAENGRVTINVRSRDGIHHNIGVEKVVEIVKK